MYYVYILTNIHLTLYIGVTNNLIRRIYEHKQDIVDGFTRKYGLKKLVYFEEFSDIQSALNREKQLKHWNRNWKLELIRKTNTAYNDLYSELIK
ncbi:MAG: GIY-YIG nuclease family protein [Patescibacteria group bacterium]